MFLTNVLLKKAKSKFIMVTLRSTGSDHSIITMRERIGNPKEIIFRDPWINRDCVYKEEKKIRSLKRFINITSDRRSRSYGKIPDELQAIAKKT